MINFLDNVFGVADEYFKDEKEFRHFGGNHLNKLINKHCRKDMTVIDGDCIQHKINLNGKEYIRDIEYKHHKDSMSQVQLNLLLRRAKDAKIVMEHEPDQVRQVYIIQSDYPFQRNNIVKNLITGASKTLNYDDFIKFLNFELEV